MEGIQYNQIVALATLAVLTKVTYSLATVFSPKVEVSPQKSKASELDRATPKVLPELLERFPPERIKHIQAKELRRYKERQSAKWQHWLENMSR